MFHMCLGGSVEFLLSTHMFWLRNVNNEFSLCTFSPVSCGFFRVPTRLQCVTVLWLLQVTENLPYHVLVEIFYYTPLSRDQTL